MNEETFFPAVPGMSEEEVMMTVQKVIDKIAPKYTFFGYDVDDIKQESFFICRKGMEKFDPEQGELENFLSVHLPHRLLNLIRKNSMNKGSNEDKQRIYKPAQLDEGFNQGDDGEIDYGKMDYGDMIQILDRELPSHMRRDWLKMVHDAPVSKARRREVTLVVQEILAEYGYEDEHNLY